MRERLEQAMWESSGAADEMAYIQYQQMESANALNADGFYQSEQFEEQKRSLMAKPSGTIHVSFAKNEFLQVEYYRDASMSEPLEAYNCWLNPGDAIFTSVPVVMNQRNEFYQFSEFRVYEIDENRNNRKLLAIAKDLPGLLYQIPDDFSGIDLVIIPLGEYQDHTINMKAVYAHADGTETLLENGVWSINGKAHGNGSVDLNPMGSYRIVYDYGSYQDRWYMDRSEPDYYWEKSSDATVTFLLEPGDNTINELKVKLHPYGSLTIENGIGFQNVMDSLLDGAANIFGNKSIIETQNIIDLLQVNGITQINNFSDTEIQIPKIRVGDEILLRLPADLKANAEGLTLPASTLKDGIREYRFLIPDAENMNFRLSVSRRNSDADGVFHSVYVEHGTLSVLDPTGIPYRDGSELPEESERVTVMITPEENYCIYGKNVKNNVYQAEMKYSSFESDLPSILMSHSIRPGIMVTIDTEDELGNCVFWSGTEMLSGNVMLREGQDLQFDYLLNTDAEYEIILTPEEKKEIINVWSPYAASRELDVTESMQGMVLRCRDFITLQERVITDDITNFD